MVRHRRRDGCSGDRGLGCRCAGRADADGAAADERRRVVCVDRRARRPRHGYDVERADGACPGSGIRDRGARQRRRRLRRSTRRRTTDVLLPRDRALRRPGCPERRATRRRSSSTRRRRRSTIASPAASVVGGTRPPITANSSDPGAALKSLTISVVGGAIAATADATRTAQRAPADGSYTLKQSRPTRADNTARRRDPGHGGQHAPTGVHRSSRLRPCRAARRCPGRCRGGPYTYHHHAWTGARPVPGSVTVAVDRPGQSRAWARTPTSCTATDAAGNMTTAPPLTCSSRRRAPPQPQQLSAARRRTRCRTSTGSRP